MSDDFTPATHTPDDGSPGHPLAPDAPIHHLLSLKYNPLITGMSQTELAALVQRLRTLATSAPSLTSAIKAESTKTAVRPRAARALSPEAAKRKALLDDL